MKNAIELNPHVIGYTQYTTPIPGMILPTIVIIATRITHQNASITNIGTTDFPAPRSTADIAWEYASKKKKNASTLALSVPYMITSGVLSNAAVSAGAKI